ncbi:hypothetical protein ACI2KR_07665 [Pseudomonas luteola]
MPFVARKEAAQAYATFVQRGLPDNGKEFEKALVKVLFKEMAGAEPLDNLYLDHREYRSFQCFRTRSKTN